MTTEPACAVKSSNADSNILTSAEHHEEHHEEHHKEHTEEEIHSDVSAKYELHCGSHIKLTFKLFEEFTSLEKITVQYVSKQQQELFSVTANSPTITLHK